MLLCEPQASFDGARDTIVLLLHTTCQHDEHSTAGRVIKSADQAAAKEHLAQAARARGLQGEALFQSSPHISSSKRCMTPHMPSHM